MKKLLSILLALALLLGMTPHALAAAPTLANFTTVQRYGGEFADVPASAWYTQTVALAYELGLVKGQSATRFAPNGEIQISESLTLACRLHSIYHTGSADFVQGSPWYQVYVDYAIANGIIAAGEYADYTAVATRAQFAKIFANVLPDAAMPYINDVAYGYIPDLTADMACYEAAYHLYRAGILQGRDVTGTFKPSTHISRAEVATIVTRMALTSQRKAFLPGVAEIIKARELGLIPAAWEGDLQAEADFAGFDQLVTALITLCDASALSTWQKNVDSSAFPQRNMLRDDGLMLLMLAAEALGYNVYNARQYGFCTENYVDYDILFSQLSWDYPYCDPEQEIILFFAPDEPDEPVGNVPGLPSTGCKDVWM